MLSFVKLARRTPLDVLPSGAEASKVPSTQPHRILTRTTSQLRSILIINGTLIIHKRVYATDRWWLEGSLGTMSCCVTVIRSFSACCTYTFCKCRIGFWPLRISTHPSPVTAAVADNATTIYYVYTSSMPRPGQISQLLYESWPPAACPTPLLRVQIRLNCGLITIFHVRSKSAKRALYTNSAVRLMQTRRCGSHRRPSVCMSWLCHIYRRLHAVTLRISASGPMHRRNVTKPQGLPKRFHLAFLWQCDSSLAQVWPP
jgi:hypothetical protein